MKKTLQALARQVMAFVRDERGASLWEYALLIIIGLGIATVLYGLRDRIRLVFVAATTSLTW
jgi:Flp pilus assembly pilin Flp